MKAQCLISLVAFALVGCGSPDGDAQSRTGGASGSSGASGRAGGTASAGAGGSSGKAGTAGGGMGGGSGGRDGERDGGGMGSGMGGGMGGGSGEAGAAGGAGTGGSTIDKIVSTPGSGIFEDEPSIVVTPTGRVVLAWDVRLGAAYQVAARVSNDGGESWGEIAMLPLGPDQNVAANTSLTATEDGTVLLAWGAERVSYGGNRSNQGVYLAKLPFDGDAFQEPVELTDPTVPVGVYDQPFVAATSRGLFLGYSQFATSLMSSEMVTRFSLDGGATWSTDMLPSSGSQDFMNGVELCRPPSGDRAYLTTVDASYGIALWRSDDGGQTWSSKTRVPLPLEYNALTFMRNGNCVADGDDVWILYGLSDDVSSSSHGKVAHLSKLRLAHSGDRGEHIDSRTDFVDLDAGPYFLFPRMVREASGALDITYYTGAGDGDDEAAYRWARSVDDGDTFVSAVLRSPVMFEQSRTTQKFLGDYMGLVWQDGRLYSAFVDNSDVSHIVFHAEDTP